MPALCFWKQIICYLFKFPIHFPSLFLVVLVLSLVLASFLCQMRSFGVPWHVL